MSARATQLTFLAVGAAHVGIGLVMLLAPGPFYDGFATFPPRNDHFIRDFATFYLALGAAFIVAAGRPSWRGPVLFVALVQYGLHLGNHLYDLGAPSKDLVGPVTAAAVGAALAALAVIAYLARAEARARARERPTRAPAP
jgi:hypothetical protein